MTLLLTKTFNTPLSLTSSMIYPECLVSERVFMFVETSSRQGKRYSISWFFFSFYLQVIRLSLKCLCMLKNIGKIIYGFFACYRHFPLHVLNFFSSWEMTERAWQCLIWLMMPLALVITIRKTNILRLNKKKTEVNINFSSLTSFYKSTTKIFCKR